MKKIITTLSAVFAVSLLAGSTALSDEIRVLNWQGYGTDEKWAVKEFTKVTGHTVVHEYFNSEQELLTKLRTNAGAYDVVLLNSAYTRQAKKEDLIGTIDVNKINNYSDLDPNMANNEELKIEGQVYGVPWTWGITSFAINTNLVKETPDTLEVFWDEKYTGKIGWRDDPLEAIQFGALATGQNINDVNDLEAIKKKLSELLPNIKTFWSSENDWNQYMAANDFAIAPFWSGSASRSISKGLPVQFIVPKEGAIGWLDSLAIPKSSKHVEAATSFINWMIDPKFNVKWSESGAPASANTVAAAALPEDSFNRTILGNPDVVSRVQFVKPISDETRKIYLELWQELKAN